METIKVKGQWLKTGKKSFLRCFSQLAANLAVYLVVICCYIRNRHKITQGSSTLSCVGYFCIRETEENANGKTRTRSTEDMLFYQNKQLACHSDKVGLD
jgi:hypothetical protein